MNTCWRPANNIIFKVTHCNYSAYTKITISFHIIGKGVNNYMVNISSSWVTID